MNEHVYLYFRFLGWVNEQRGRQMGAFFFRDFARQEREAQELGLRKQALDELTALGQAMGDYGDPVQASIEAFVEMRIEGNV